ncbi:MAG: hypothetical protein Q4D58_05915 [Synergistaceae bacterium]|nr:hypothetical protein [Synergistaceae bacterium]
MNFVRILVILLTLLAAPCRVQAARSASLDALISEQAAAIEVKEDGGSEEKSAADSFELPPVYKAALSFIISPETRRSTEAEAAAYFENGRRDKAASVIGRALGVANKYSLFYLGSFCRRVLPAAGGAEAQAEFLSGFLRGYSKAGVLIFTTEAVKEFAAYPMRRGAPWREVPEVAAAAGKGERIYRGRGLIFIPFAYGSKFKIDIISQKGGDVKMWKILPEGVNAKSWSGGNWEKEITVRGDVKF